MEYLRWKLNAMLEGVAPFVPTIGMSYGGGIIFYIDGTGQHGLIAAADDQSTGKFWHTTTTGTTGATGLNIGTGNANTDKIIALYGAEVNAARLCYDLSLNGYTDWYLPSYHEINEMYLNKIAVGGFTSNYYYWTSSENNAGNAYYQRFDTGVRGYSSKTSSYHVRAIRSF